MLSIKIKIYQIKYISLTAMVILMSSPVFISHTWAGITRNVNKNDSHCNDIHGNPYCSIKEAIEASQDADVVIIAEGTYIENGITINKDITLQGSGTRSTFIDGGNTPPRIFFVASGATVTIRDVTIQNGMDVDKGGAGVRNEGNLSLFYCTIKNNSTLSGTFPVAVHSLTGISEGLGTGGGILNTNNGILHIDRSTISGNKADYGGGVWNASGIMIVESSTFSGNTTIESGAAMSLDAETTIVNSTISSNTADSDKNDSGHAGGIAIGDFTWGIYTSDFPTDVLTIVVKNTIIAENKDASPDQGSPPHDCRGPIVSEGYNIIKVTMGCKINGVNTYDLPKPSNTTDIYGYYPNYELDVKLGSLDNNGGPTDTHVIRPGSPAIDKGDPVSCPSFDQRGFIRPIDGDGDQSVRCDIGAIELGCSDGKLAVGEECDDGNAENTDSCLNTCKLAICGDSFIEAGEEECDDGEANGNSSKGSCKVNCSIKRLSIFSNVDSIGGCGLVETKFTVSSLILLLWVSILLLSYRFVGHKKNN